MHDIADFERRGVPGVFLASTEFITAAETQIAALGVDTPRVYVQHPIQDRTDEEMRALAETAVVDIIAALTSAD